jgi:hypothetical protein
MKTENITKALFGMILALSNTGIHAGDTGQYAEDYMNKEQRQTTFCGKTFDGEILSTGATFKVHIDSECKTNTIHFLTGKKAGKTVERKIISMSDEGEMCHTKGRDYCNKMKDMGDGTYKGTGTSGKWKDKEYVKLSNIVDGNQL